jgi:putative transposase
VVMTAEQRCQIVALVCEQPEDRPISHWAGPERANDMVKRGIVPRMSPRHAVRVLKKEISHHISFARG